MKKRLKEWKNIYKIACQKCIKFQKMNRVPQWQEKKLNVDLKYVIKK